MERRLVCWACALLLLALGVFLPRALRHARKTPVTPGVRVRQTDIVTVWQAGTLVPAGGELRRQLARHERQGGARAFLRSVGEAELYHAAVRPGLYLFTPDCAPDASSVRAASVTPLYSEFYCLVYPVSAHPDGFSWAGAGMAQADGRALVAACEDMGLAALALTYPQELEPALYGTAQAARDALEKGKAACAVLPERVARALVDTGLYGTEALAPVTERTVYAALDISSAPSAAPLLGALSDETAQAAYAAQGVYAHRAAEASPALRLPDPFAYASELDALLALSRASLLSGDVSTLEARLPTSP